MTIVLCFYSEPHLLQDQAPTRGRQAYPPRHSSLCLVREAPHLIAPAALATKPNARIGFNGSVTVVQFPLKLVGVIITLLLLLFIYILN